MRARVKSSLFVNYLTFNYLFARVWKSGYFACQPVKPYPSLRFLHPIFHRLNRLFTQLNLDLSGVNRDLAGAMWFPAFTARNLPEPSGTDIQSRQYPIFAA